MAGRGANIQNLNQQILASLNIPVPPMELQNQFVDFIDQTNKTKLTIQASLDKLEVMKKALMQEYFG
jgi:type I restriction enzyme S subunit